MVYCIWQPLHSQHVKKHLKTLILYHVYYFDILESSPPKPPKELPPNVTDADKDLFKQAQEKAQEVLNQVCIDI